MEVGGEKRPSDAKGSCRGSRLRRVHRGGTAVCTMLLNMEALAGQEKGVGVEVCVCVEGVGG